MDNVKNCDTNSGCKMHGCTIIGAIFIILGTILTIFTLSGFGILGMFLVGLVFCCHKKISSKTCCACCKCCNTSEAGDCHTVNKA